MMNTVLLDKAKYDRNRFNCGIEALNNYLKVMASQKAKKDNTRTFVFAYTGAIRTSIPALSGHPFRFNPDTDSGISQPVFC